MNATAETMPTTRDEKRLAIAESIAAMPTDLVPMDSPMATILNPTLYKHLMTVAAQFATSQLVPKHFQNKPADVFVALHMAYRMGCDPILVLQNLYIVHGTPGWKAQFMIAQVNRARAFGSSIRWRTEKLGEPLAIERDVSEWIGGNKQKKTVKAHVDNLAVTAYARDKETGEELAITVSMAMAAAEGWTDNEKYSSLPELMLMYRSAALLIRLYAPESMLGVPLVDEIETLREPRAPASPSEIKTYSAADLSTLIKGTAAPKPTESPQEGVSYPPHQETPVATAPPNAAYLDRLTLIKDAQDMADLEAIKELSFDALDENQIKSIGVAIGHKAHAFRASRNKVEESKK